MGLLFQFVSSLPAWQLLLPFCEVKVLACYESLSPDLSVCLLFLWTSLSCPQHPNVVVVSHQGSFWVLLWKVCSSGNYLCAGAQNWRVGFVGGSSIPIGKGAQFGWISVKAECLISSALKQVHWTSLVHRWGVIFWWRQNNTKQGQSLTQNGFITAHK